MAANMLEDVDREEWKGRGLSEGDVMFAVALGPIFLRINSIELGLKHILDNEMGRPVPRKHDLVILWNLLTDEWREKVAEASCVRVEDIRDTGRDRRGSRPPEGDYGRSSGSAPRTVRQLHANRLSRMCGHVPGHGGYAARRYTDEGWAAAGQHAGSHMRQEDRGNPLTSPWALCHPLICP